MSGDLGSREICSAGAELPRVAMLKCGMSELMPSPLELPETGISTCYALAQRKSTSPGRQAKYSLTEVTPLVRIGQPFQSKGPGRNRCLGPAENMRAADGGEDIGQAAEICHALRDLALLPCRKADAALSPIEFADYVLVVAYLLGQMRWSVVLVHRRR